MALTSASFLDDGYDFGGILKPIKQRPSWPNKAALKRSPKCYVPIVDRFMQGRIQSYFYAWEVQQDEAVISGGQAGG